MAFTSLFHFCMSCHSKVNNNVFMTVIITHICILEQQKNYLCNFLLTFLKKVYIIRMNLSEKLKMRAKHKLSMSRCPPVTEAATIGAGSRRVISRQVGQETNPSLQRS
jgi:hypothetical protein